MKIVIIGSSGQLGKNLRDVLKTSSNSCVFLDRSKLDVTIIDQIQSVKKYYPDYIINATAYTAVDLAEENIDLAFMINQKAVGEIAGVAESLDVPLIHISTDYVFDGNSETPYKEDDQINPLGVYGHSKSEGEQEVIQKLRKHIIIRTAWAFSEYGNNFLKTMYNLKEKKELSVVDDQYGSPTYARHLADSIVKIVETLEVYKKQNKPFVDWGIYHYCGDKKTTWYEFSKNIFEYIKKQNTSLNVPKLHSIPMSKYKTKATKPKFSVLDCSKINRVFKIKPSNWKEGIACSIEGIEKGLSEV